MTKVLFTELDGTLIRTKSGKRFPLHSEDWVFIPETIKVLQYYISRGYTIAIITNQNGVESGVINEQVFINKIESICNKLEKILKIKKNSISYRYCIKKESYNSKPLPGMAFDILTEEELTLTESIMLGKTEEDIQFAANAGIDMYISMDDILFNDWE